MRIVFLIPELRRDLGARASHWLRGGRLRRILPARRGLWTTEEFGGVLNIMRHCALARSLGVDAVLATENGTNAYDDCGTGPLPVVGWSARERTDLCVVPDVFSNLVESIEGAVVVFYQGAGYVRRDFDHHRAGVSLWACSPYMIERCREAFPGKVPALVPVIVDPQAFPFVEQARREPGRLAALPRKNCLPFIEATYRRYRERGGRYWKLDLIEGVPFRDFARRYGTPQALLPASAVEGFGLPGAEAMAAGIAVAGSDAGGASFYMRDRDTALVANDPDRAATALLEIEDPALRERLSQNGRRFIERLFPDAEPRRFWENFVAAL